MHQLLQPFLGKIDELPLPQLGALRAAFGITDAAAPNIFLIALATLDLLGELAQLTSVLDVAV